VIAGESVPAGFDVTTGERGALLVADRAWVAELLAAGLDSSARWDRALALDPRSSGRGRSVALALASGRALRLKRIARGGLLGGLWAGRLAGTARALDNLRLALEARALGLPTPAPVALLVEPAGPGLVRAWLAVEELAGAADLRQRLHLTPPPLAELDSALALVRRMHELGLEHRDLNLGNLLVQGQAVFIIDLDRARLHRGPLSFAQRQRALRRLERSVVKSWYPAAAPARLCDRIYEAYAAADETLGARLNRGRRTGRWLVRLHHLGWSVPTRGPRSR